MDSAIDIKNVHITYQTINSIPFKQFFTGKKVKRDRFEAVKGATFSVKKGEIIGLVGRNGSGKSTLLRAVAGVFSPDQGEIDLHGNSVSLLAIGIGFQRELPGSDNIYLAGLLMGKSLEEIQERYDEIVAFSELGDFIHKPVSTYSSGMYSKLSFSISCILPTDVMLIDEVLSVGDVAFRKKSAAKLRDLIREEDRTVIIVSHNSETIRSLCDRVIWLHHGEMKMVGETNEVMDVYEAFMAELAQKNA
ncbi:MAG: ABC transporter ATP-binding protein [Clostridia bacterium]|nr:ABC transporter ATP-binding protein [Clostridia bacterium]